MTGEFYQTFKGEIIPFLYNLFQKVEVTTLPNTFYEASVTLIMKSDKDITRKGNYRSIPLIKIDVKILNKY